MALFSGHWTQDSLLGKPLILTLEPRILPPSRGTVKGHRLQTPGRSSSSAPNVHLEIGPFTHRPLLSVPSCAGRGPCSSSSHVLTCLALPSALWVDPTLVLMFSIRKLGLREARWLFQGHRAHKQKLCGSLIYKEGPSPAPYLERCQNVSDQGSLAPPPLQPQRKAPPNNTLSANSQLVALGAAGLSTCVREIYFTITGKNRLSAVHTYDFFRQFFLITQVLRVHFGTPPS